MRALPAVWGIDFAGVNSFMITPVLLAGGSGTRLWPLSRELFPKQFLPLTGKDSLLQATLKRLDRLPAEPCIVVCGEAHRFIVAEQMRDIDIQDARILLEPAGRDTAPAIAAAALEALHGSDKDPVLLVLPSDHVIADIDAFISVVQAGEAQAREGQLVTFGIVPTEPATGYGYIQIKKPDEAAEQSVLPLLSFTEKPDAERAQEYLNKGDYYWNSGMFMFRAKDYLARLKLLAPAIYEACLQAHESARREADFIRLDEAAFKRSPSDSIDYAVMEKTEAAVVIPLDAGWSDLGSWDAVAQATGPDAQGNVEQGDVLSLDNHNCLLRSEQRLIAAIGLENIVVIETADAVLVAEQGQLQKVKTLVKQLKNDQREEAINHRKVPRPWGSYETLSAGSRFQVKRIVVKPGASLSLQMHHHRAEHWVVVHGTAEVHCDEQVLLLSENQSTYIPLGSKHRLVNPGTIALELIEIQSGSYLGEDDIVRFEDSYGRLQN